MTISADALQNAAQKYAESPAGKKRIKAYLKEARTKGAVLPGGKRVASVTEMTWLAEEFRKIILSRIPSAIQTPAQTLSAGSPRTRSDGGYEVVLGFNPSAVERNSLREDGEWDYKGEPYSGIINIVALFNNGYRASNYVYGYWDGHSSTSGSVGDSRNAAGSGFAWIRSKKEREALRFMQDAVAEFNGKYGAKYGVEARLGSMYRE
jgi:hypothetical protein